VTAEFSAIAARLAALEGAPSLPRLELPYPFEGLPLDVVRAHARHAYPTLVALLGVS
jgi:hypothetical protein